MGRDCHPSLTRETSYEPAFAHDGQICCREATNAAWKATRTRTPAAEGRSADSPFESVHYDRTEALTALRQDATNGLDAPDDDVRDGDDGCDDEAPQNLRWQTAAAQP